MSTKYIFISGGVISGLGKGITTASIALLLKSAGFAVSPVKIDMYLNIDAGTIRPQEHGEIFVTDDGIETDEDLGHYERFLNESMTRVNYITTGQIYQEVIRKERAFEYNGEDVEAIPYVTDEIAKRVKLAGTAKNADIVLVELGGTVGEYQNVIFFETNRIMKLKAPGDVFHIHVAYLPVLVSIGELKSKPVQTSVHTLNSLGIQPDFVFTRSEKPIDQRRRERLALFCNVTDSEIIDSPDIESIYEVPLNLERQRFSEKLFAKLGIDKKRVDLGPWQKMVEKGKKASKEVKIALVGKYFVTGDYMLADSYISVVEALKHAGTSLGIKPCLFWIDSEKIEKEGTKILEDFDGLIVPQGWGSRGIEGKVATVKFAREQKIPYLGLCFGMQMAVIEFGRHVCGLKDANTGEAGKKTSHEVIHIMPDQAKYLVKRQYGGTIRLGAWPCKLVRGTKTALCYEKHSKSSFTLYPKPYPLIYERHRHRYEFNNKYRQIMTKKGLVISGVSPDGKLVEAIELAGHPFFIGTQFHPEYKSRPLSPHPLFLEFLKACQH
ncbi:MAG: CTP synthase [Microgenomates group bacterium LiPW_16]|nr:MAG: CTP synthase [Microgenomates group bacterium LiPW_16]